MFDILFKLFHNSQFEWNVVLFFIFFFIFIFLFYFILFYILKNITCIYPVNSLESAQTLKCQVLAATRSSVYAYHTFCAMHRSSFFLFLVKAYPCKKLRWAAHGK